jgi:hypothetical protein
MGTLVISRNEGRIVWIPLIYKWTITYKLAEPSESDFLFFWLIQSKNLSTCTLKYWIMNDSGFNINMWRGLEQEAKIFLLAYYSCTGGYIVTFTYVLTIYLRLTLSIFLPCPLPPFIEQFQQVSFYFHTWIQNTDTVFTLLHPFLMPFPHLLVSTSR